MKSPLKHSIKQLIQIRSYLKSKAEPTKVSTLKNGLTVASENLPGHFASFGVFLDFGSRFENESKFKGASHLLDRMAFKVGDDI